MNADNNEGIEKRLTDLTSLFVRRLSEDKNTKQLVQQVADSLKRRDEIARGEAFKQLFSEMLLAMDRFAAGAPSVELNETFMDELQEILGHYGLRPIVNDGLADPRLHEVVGTVPAGDDGVAMKIVEVKRPGYLIGDRVLRASRVVVTK